MINRILIRIKILQIFFAYNLRNDGNVKAAEKELQLSIQKAYDLYHYLLQLIVLLTNTEQKRIDNASSNLSKVIIKQDMRLYKNRLAEQLRTNRTLNKFTTEKGTIWGVDDPYFLKELLKKIILSEYYEEYTYQDDSYENDREFWNKVFQHIIITDEDVNNILENNNIYWNDDLEIIASFVVKTMNKFQQESTEWEPLTQMYNRDEDRELAFKLLQHSIVERHENKKRINNILRNWDIERVAQTDLNILQIALSELLNFPSIPISVTLNEYIDLSRYYSTPKSPSFINGTLDALVHELQYEGILFKA
ncbi:MAG: transcription antitermination factor NusB [Dysgonamonadaceae bacterium]|nr:transcription antitermination factor NusB [Dysgonamonadaceae bacterium]